MLMSTAKGRNISIPNPVEALLGHAKSDDDVHMIAVVLLRWVFQRSRNTVTLGRIIVDQIGDSEHAAIRPLDQLILNAISY